MTDRNLALAHRRQAERLGPVAALRFKRYGLYHDLSWAQYYAAARACGSALIECGINKGDRVGLLAENSVEWLIADMGLLAAGAINVPPHAPLTAKQVCFQLFDAGVRWLFVSTREQLEKIEQVLAELPALEGIVVFDDAAVPATATKPKIWSWTSFIQLGRQALKHTAVELDDRADRLGLDDLATIMYTSGTTGNPKGVMLTHGNLISNSLSTIEASAHKPDDMVLTWLPFSHIYSRTCDHYRNLIEGITVSLAESPETLVQNLEEVKPTHFSSVPRFYEKVLTSVASDDPKKTARRLRDIFGPRIDWLMSGGAPLPVAIGEAFHAAGLNLLQGYGLTETSPVISCNRKERFKIASAGLPLPGVEVKIAPDGEVLARGPLIMKGYWNNPQATAETIKDGWLYTGDLGRLDEDGFLYITGRKKELMVLSNGKKLVPNYIEGLLLSDECIDQAVVYGEGRNFLTALIVPHWDNVKRQLQAKGVSVDSQPPEKLAESADVRSLLEERMAAALADVSSWEQVKKFIILPNPFTVAAEELTVSLKLRRSVVLKKHRELLEALYG